MRQLRTSLLFASLFIMVGMAFATEFPLRTKYADVKTISTTDLTDQRNNCIVIDVRSQFEYDVMQINGSHNCAISLATFEALLEQIPNISKDSKMVFYCNGHTCAKSYKAAVKATELGYTNVYAYDAGIFEWTEMNPSMATLMGKTPVDPSKLISSATFRTRLLDIDAFSAGTKSEGAFVVDIRDMAQRKNNPDFGFMSSVSPLNAFAKMITNEAFKTAVTGRTFYIYDATGKQVRWLQYHLEANGYSDYYFLEGGVWSIFGDAGAN